jgi:hypothetical protein
MKYVKKYKMFLESLTEKDIEVNSNEPIYSGEYPNVKVVGDSENNEQEVVIEEPTTKEEPSI